MTYVPAQVRGPGGQWQPAPPPPPAHGKEKVVLFFLTILFIIILAAEWLAEKLGYDPDSDD